MSQETATILGHEVVYDTSIYEGGVRYLARLSHPEAKIFFDTAYYKGSAIFENHMGGKYKLSHANGAYQLIKA